ncbi:MAG: DUF1949 domain-containing protein [Calditrichaeota bacterium]|nr:MAG: DUF1949 domain-containing protein [Calditrichota bacterium]
MTESFFTITRAVSCELREKRSLFIGQLLPVKSVAEAEAALEDIRKTYHDATHNCFAYRIDPDHYRFSDDGEPSGTAGRPILAMLEKYRLLQVLLVVTRYFGGIKLGTGGLKRAYSACAEQTILQAERVPFSRFQSFRLQYPYSLSRQVEQVLRRHGAQLVSADYGEEITALVQVPEEAAGRFVEALKQLPPAQMRFAYQDSTWKSA